MMDQKTQFKKQAGEYAVHEMVTSGMTIGLGHGSTAVWAIRLIAEKMADGDLTDIKGIPASNLVEKEARDLGVPLTTLDTDPVIDVTIDGADEADRTLALIKGGGGALLKEKMLAQASKREVIVVDHEKVSDKIGTLWPVPIEVVPFGWRNHLAFLSEIGGQGGLRMLDNDGPFHTDHGNYIIDWRFGPISDPDSLDRELKSRAGIVEHGLFIHLATDLIIAGPDGVEHLAI